MNKIDAIYGNILCLLKNITLEADNLTTYISSLSSEKQETIISLAETIENKKSELVNSKNQGLIFSDFSSLLLIVQKLIDDFSDYPNHRYQEIFVLISLLASLSEAIDDEVDNTEIIDTELFSFVKLEKNIYHKNFVFYDSMNLENSICLFDFSDISSIKNFLNEQSLSVELYIHLLANIGVDNSRIETNKYVLIKSDQKEKQSSIWSYVAVHLVKAGYLVHQPSGFLHRPTVSNLRTIKAGELYQQFNDSLIILSEYNDKGDILDKYLRLYHVFENFMYKFPLVTLERFYSGSVFSIRDFQKMNERLDNSEPTSLANLFKKILEKEYMPSKKFDVYVTKVWTDLISTTPLNKSKADLFLSLLRISTKSKDYKFDDVLVSNMSNFLPKIVYAYRNSIVHNRETEFHLNHETLLYHSSCADTAKILLEHFLIPVLEEIVFFLILERNDIVWFGNSTIKLWDE